jgi:hypothetical protein
MQNNNNDDDGDDDDDDDRRTMLCMTRRQENKRDEDPALQLPSRGKILGLDRHALGVDRKTTTPTTSLPRTKCPDLESIHLTLLPRNLVITEAISEMPLGCNRTNVPGRLGEGRKMHCGLAKSSLSLNGCAE